MTKDFVTIKVSRETREKIRAYASKNGLSMFEAVDDGIDLLVKTRRLIEPSRYANFDGKQNHIQGA